MADVVANCDNVAAQQKEGSRAAGLYRATFGATSELASKVDALAREVERQGGKLATHDAAILKLLAEIRRLTQFPENPRRGIGFTAEWPKGR